MSLSKRLEKIEAQLNLCPLCGTQHPPQPIVVRYPEGWGPGGADADPQEQRLPQRRAVRDRERDHLAAIGAGPDASRQGARLGPAGRSRAVDRPGGDEGLDGAEEVVITGARATEDALAPEGDHGYCRRGEELVATLARTEDQR
jgi:hypothetical protein